MFCVVNRNYIKLSFIVLLFFYLQVVWYQHSKLSQREVSNYLWLYISVCICRCFCSFLV